MELDYLRELKKPVDDMMLKNLIVCIISYVLKVYIWPFLKQNFFSFSMCLFIYFTCFQELPTVNRIPGVKLCGKAFADTLMAFEFLHNFGETLGFGMCYF